MSGGQPIESRGGSTAHCAEVPCSASDRLLAALRAMDWEAFWAGVTRKATPEIEGYHNAQRAYKRHPRTFV